MKNSVVMAVGDAAAELVQERFQNTELQPAFAAVKILLQVQIEKLKHQRQLLFRVHNIIQSAGQAKLEPSGGLRRKCRSDCCGAEIVVMQRACVLRVGCCEPDDVWMLELFEERNLADGCARDAFILSLQPNFFQGHNLPRHPIFSFVHNPVGTLADFLELLIALHPVRCLCVWLARRFVRTGSVEYASRVCDGIRTRRNTRSTHPLSKNLQRRMSSCNV